jgi:hypothetical protein
MDVADSAQLLRETALCHGAYEAVTPPHDWWDWYAAYMVRRSHCSVNSQRPAAMPAARRGTSSRRYRDACAQ